MRPAPCSWFPAVRKEFLLGLPRLDCLSKTKQKTRQTASTITSSHNVRILSLTCLKPPWSSLPVRYKSSDSWSILSNLRRNQARKIKQTAMCTKRHRRKSSYGNLTHFGLMILKRVSMKANRASGPSNQKTSLATHIQQCSTLREREKFHSNGENTFLAL